VFFWKKTVKIRLSIGRSALNPQFASNGWGLCPQTSALL